jgi:hypothetical protein
MLTLARYQQEPETTRTRVREAIAAQVRRQREHLARLYAAEAVIALRRQLPDAARLTFRIGESELDPAGATVDIVAVFDPAGAPLWPDLSTADRGDLDEQSLICDMLAAATEQGGPDFFATPGGSSSPLPGSATHGLTIADLDPGRTDEAVLAALNLRTYPADRGQGDRSAHVVLEVLGVTIGVRHRATETFVHLGTEELADQFRPLVVEVDSGGENTYGEL